MAKEVMTPGIMLIDTDVEARKAVEYFSVLEKTEKSSFSGVNQYGIVDLVRMTNKAAAFVKGVGDDLNAVIEGLSNILIAAVLKHAGTDDQKKVSPDLWEDAFNHMARLFFSTYEKENLHYDDKKVGEDVVETVVAIGFDVVGLPTGHLKEAIEKYLQKQGELLNKLTFDSSMTDPYTLIDFVNCVSKSSHVCGLRSYFTNFTANTIKIKKSCKDPELKYDFVFDITRCSANFMLNSWETDPLFRKRVQQFIDDHRPDDDFFDLMDTTHDFNAVSE